jgi:transcriptional regulator with XRE-family HTH domain
MKNFHEPLKLPANWHQLVNRDADADENCIAVGGLAAKLGQLRGPSLASAARPISDTAAEVPDGLSQAAGLGAIARLVQLARREARETPEQFAKKAQLSKEEVELLEAAATPPEPRVLYSIGEALGVSYQKLLTLAGHKKERDENLEQQVLRFAASSAPMDKLSRVESQALHDFLRLLHD